MSSAIRTNEEQKNFEAKRVEDASYHFIATILNAYRLSPEIISLKELIAVTILLPETFNKEIKEEIELLIKKRKLEIL